MDNNILLVHQIPEKIIEIVKNSKEYCFLITPYFQAWPILERELEKAAQDNKKIIFVFRDEYNAKNKFFYLNEKYDFDLVFVERLHTKLYMNEKESLISSMNLYDSSKENNFELAYYFSDAIKAKDFKSIVIDEDILKNNPVIIEGRYFRKEREDKEKLSFLSESTIFHSNDENSMQDKDSGFCSNCGIKIRYNIKMPFCPDCYKKLRLTLNKNTELRFCHKCGAMILWDFPTFANPLCCECK